MWLKLYSSCYLSLESLYTVLNETIGLQKKNWKSVGMEHFYLYFTIPPDQIGLNSVSTLSVALILSLTLKAKKPHVVVFHVQICFYLKFSHYLFRSLFSCFPNLLCPKHVRLFQASRQHITALWRHANHQIVILVSDHNVVLCCLGAWKRNQISDQWSGMNFGFANFLHAGRCYP